MLLLDAVDLDAVGVDLPLDIAPLRPLTEDLLRLIIHQHEGDLYDPIVALNWTCRLQVTKQEEEPPVADRLGQLVV